MTYVVTEACIRRKYTDCVDVCPTDAFREGPHFLVIDPDDCIDCTRDAASRRRARMGNRHRIGLAYRVGAPPLNW